MADRATFSRQCPSCQACVTIVVPPRPSRTLVVAQIPWPLLCRMCDAWWRERLDLKTPREMSAAGHAERYYVITDSEGNTLDSFDDEHAAETALLAIAAERPEREDELLLASYTDKGVPAARCARLARDVRQEQRLRESEGDS